MKLQSWMKMATLSALIVSAAAMTGSATTISLAPSRVDGVAPLYVFFDASNTTHQDSSLRPFHDLDYSWTFGDPSSGAWSTDGKPKNEATGPVTAHVFDPAFQAGETQRQFAVTLSVRDPQGAVATQQVTITVRNPDSVFSGSKTTCVSTSGNFSGCPTGALHVAGGSFSSSIAAGQRVLLRRGESFNGGTINAAGPGTLGAFGSGNKPRVPNVQLSGSSPKLQDWRIMDLELPGGDVGIRANGTIKQVLIYRNDMHDYRVGVLIDYSALDYMNSHGNGGHTRHDQVAIADGTIKHGVGGSGGNLAFLGAERLSVLGTIMQDSLGVEHVMRTPHIGRGVISHNKFRDQPSIRNVLKLHAPVWNMAGLGFNQYSERFVLSDNEIKNGDASGADWAVGLGPQAPIDNDGSIIDQRVRNVIIERNHFRSGAGQDTALCIWASEVTVRNNVFELNSGDILKGITVTKRGTGQVAPNNARIFNNTFYSNNTGKSVQAIEVTGSATNTMVKNNILVRPSASGATVLSGTILEASNSVNKVLTSGGFVVSSPVNPGDFALLSNSAAVNAGTPVPVARDYALKPRPQGGAYDLGAFEYGTGGATTPTYYSLTASAGAGGSITPSGNVLAAAGASQSFTIAANSGYAISAVLVDGVSIGAASSYTFGNVQANHTISATFSPTSTTTFYTLSVTAANGSVTKSPNASSYAAGSQVTLTATPSAGYQFSGWSGSASGSANPLTLTMDANKSVTAGFTAIPVQAGQSVSALVLINANTGLPIRPLVNGGSIVLGTDGAALNVRADTNPGVVGSVVFKYDGALFSTESIAPYALAGNPNGVYTAWTPTVGQHTIVATPYTGSAGTGTAGTPISVTFTVSQTAAPTVTSLTLVNASTDRDLRALTANSTINLSVDGKALNIRANTSGTIGSVKFQYDGQTPKYENYAPYTFAGNTGNDYWSWTPTVGYHTMVVTAFSGANGTGTAGPSITVRFNVTSGSTSGSLSTGTSMLSVRTVDGTGRVVESRPRAVVLSRLRRQALVFSPRAAEVALVGLGGRTYLHATNSGGELVIPVDGSLDLPSGYAVLRVRDQDGNTETFGVISAR